MIGLRKRDPSASLAARLRGPFLFAAVLIGGFFAGIGMWSANASLTSAAVAPGVVGLDAERKVVQHLEGGILAEIHVKEGDAVQKGDLLVVLDDTIARSTLDLLRGQYIDMLATRARIAAEQSGLDHVETPPELAQLQDDPRAAQAMAAQRALFDSRRKAYASRVEILNSKITKLGEQIKGFEAQEIAYRRQIEIIRKEEADIEDMVQRGLERAPRLYALQREVARIEGVLGELTARRSEAQVLIGETRLMLLEMDAKLKNQLAGEFSDLSARIADMGPRLNAARDKLERTRIRAPVSGTVVSLAQHTIGGVIGAGQPILDIVPSDMKLMVAARVSPTEIDVVRNGLPAEVRLTAFSARTTPTVPGRVVHVSADRLIDPNDGTPYYAVHVQLDPDAGGQNLGIDLSELYPGMPVEVMVVTGKKTVLDYFLQPVTDVLARTFRES